MGSGRSLAWGDALFLKRSVNESKRKRIRVEFPQPQKTG